MHHLVLEPMRQLALRSKNKDLMSWKRKHNVLFGFPTVETGTKTSMEDSDGDLSVQREAFQSELYHNQIPAKNL